MADLQPEINPNGNGLNKPTGSDKGGAEIKDSALAKEREDLDKPYTEKKIVTIMLAGHQSLYRQVNSKVLNNRKDFIGASITSSQMLAANRGEVEAYMPSIIGMSTNNPDFATRVKQYFNSFSVCITELGKEVDASFRYNRYGDYLQIKAKEEKIEADYDNADKNNIQDLRKAIAQKVKALHDLESTKYQYGYPINIDAYYFYRHCLLYKQVAKDPALINADSSIRFYFKDDNKEKARLEKNRRESTIAKRNFIALLDNQELFNAVYTLYCVSNNLSVIDNIIKDSTEKEMDIDKWSVDEPAKFNEAVSDKTTKVRGEIELLIARGEFIRSEFNQNISTADGDFIGANVKEAVAFFNNPINKDIVEVYRNKLKL